MKKKIVLLLTFIILLSTVLVSADQDESIQWLIDKGVVEGRLESDGSINLALDENITRAEFTTILVRGLKLEASNTTVLTDIEGHWAENYINSAVADDRNIIQGYGDGSFKPNNNIKISELAAMLVRTAKADLTDEMKEDAVWPDSYITWADQLDLFDDLDIDNVGKEADRKTAFVMLYNTFDAMDLDEDDVDDVESDDIKDDDDKDEHSSADRKNAFDQVYNAMDAQELVDHGEPYLKAGDTAKVTVKISSQKNKQGISFNFDNKYLENESGIKAEKIDISNTLDSIIYSFSDKQLKYLKGAKVQYSIDDKDYTSTINNSITIKIADLKEELLEDGDYELEIHITPKQDVPMYKNM